MGERRGKMINWLVEDTSQFDASDGRWKVVEWLIKTSPETYANKGGREKAKRLFKFEFSKSQISKS